MSEGMGVAQDNRPRARGLPGPAWIKLLAAFVVPLILVRVVPQSRPGLEPPVEQLVVAAALVAAVACSALFWILRSDMSLPLSIALYAVGFNVLIVVVKFVLAPRGVYEANQRAEFETFFGSFNEPFVAILVAIIVFLLYAVSFTILYRLFRRRLLVIKRDPERRKQLLGRVVWLLAVAILLTAASGGFVLIIPLALTGEGAQYIGYVFSSSASLITALALAGAGSLAAFSLKSVTERAEAVGDVAVLVTFFWVALYFIAIYHVLWVVYILALTALWPLRVVVPK